MAELRAYALAVTELRGVPGATGSRADAWRARARQTSGAASGAVTVRDALGPLYRRVPGARVVRHDDPTPADLELLLAGSSVPPDRAAATWRLVETLAAGLAWSATVVTADVPPGLLGPLGLPVPPTPGPTAGWSSLASAAAIPGLRDWLTGADAWVAAAGRAGRPAPDLVAFCT